MLSLCKKLTAVELDRDLLPVLEAESARFGMLEVINADILKFELSHLPGEKRFRLLGNLPYNISTPQMFHLLESVTLIQDMHFMVQKEVALRICAASGEPNYGRLSVMLQYHCECQYLFDVGPESFTPPPKVDSAIIRLLPHQQPKQDIGDYDIFSTIVRSACSQRRKTISNSLKTILDRETFVACDINPGLRAENLRLEDFAKLSRANFNDV